VADGTRTHDHLDHNQGLYQLSYSHRARLRIAALEAASRPQSQS
jgi:metal-dependent hydrolase (beta-lactamase superfamily II)